MELQVTCMMDGTTDRKLDDFGIRLSYPHRAQLTAENQMKSQASSESQRSSLQSDLLRWNPELWMYT